MNALISAQNLSAGFGTTSVLTGINLSITAGEIVTIVGPNGSGKTTLIKSLIGAIRPSMGQVIAKPQLKVGYVPQRLHVDTTLPLSVARFLQLPRRHSKAETLRAIELAGAEGLNEKPLSDLSGGQFQRVLLARALLGRPELLILDEPTQGLDQPGAAAFYNLIETLRDGLGLAVLMVSHDLHVVMSASDRVICLNGHVCCEGRPEVVASAPEYRALFGAGTHGALALYRHEHDHSHDADADAESDTGCGPRCGPGCDHDHDHARHAAG